MRSSGLRSSTWQTSSLQTSGMQTSRLHASTTSGAAQFAAPHMSTQMSAHHESVHLSSAVGGFALDSAPGESTLPDRRRNRLERLVESVERSLPLPTSPRGYLLYLCWLVLIVGGMGILALMSAQILEARMQLQSLHTEHTLVQQRNSELVWLIARETNLERVQRRLAGKGYIAATDYDYDMQYVVLGGPALQPGQTELNLVQADDTPRGPRVVAQLSTPLHTDASATASALPAGAEITPDTIALLTGRASAQMDPAAFGDAQGESLAIPADLTTSVPGEALPAEPGLSAALAEGISRWELVFLHNRPERPAAGLHTAAYTSSADGAGWGWQDWWTDLRSWSRDSLTGMDSAWPWTGE